jgi:hypothetical protein
MVSRTHLISPGMQMVSNPVGTFVEEARFSQILRTSESEFVEEAPLRESVGAAGFLQYLAESRTFSSLKTRTYGSIATSYRNPALRKDPRIVNDVLVGS